MASKHNIFIEQGSTFHLYLTWKDPNETPIDLTGFRIRMQVRQEPESAATLLDFDSDALTSGQHIAALDATGIINITLDPSVTSALSFKGAEWDLLAISSGGEATRILEGKASVSLAVTR